MNPHALHHYRLQTFDPGELVPVGLVEVLPGDVFRHSASMFLRVTPLAAPVMHPVQLRLHHFYVPHRIVWEEAGGTGDWEDFITGGNSGTDSQAVPTMATTGTVSDLLNYLGCPPTAGVNVSALPVAGFNRIFNEWYRDQDLVTARDWDDLTIPKVAWGKDYLTAARPWAQRGDAVSLPLGTDAPVTIPGKGPQASDDFISLDSNDQVYRATGATAGNAMIADLSNATAASVRDLRLAFALQRYRELRAQFGARYAEYLSRAYGVRNQDGRIQEPEYLGGGSSMVQFSEVMQTATDVGARDYSVGDLYGHGIAAARTNAYRRQFPEWGYVFTLASVRPASVYMDGIPRTWLRQDKEDFYQRELENIGEQSVYKNEVFADSVDGDSVFGYQGRYDDYRGCLSGVAGEFYDVLDYWHLGRKFSSDPALNATFVTCDPPKRIYNEQTQHALWTRVHHQIGALRHVSRRATTRTL